MTRGFSMLLLITLIACGQGRDISSDSNQKDKPKAGLHKADSVLPKDKTAFDKARPDGDAVKSEENRLNKRENLIKEEWNRYEDTLISHSAQPLTDDEKEMLRHLVEAAKLVEDLYMLQLHPENLTWRDEVLEDGTEMEKRLFYRYQAPWCEDNPSKECAAIEDAPDKKVGWMHWPNDFSKADVDKMSTLINVDELRSPFTVVRRGDDKRLEAQSFSQTSLGPRMKEVASLLRAASQKAPHKSLKKFLNSRADAFESPSAFPYDQSDYDWIGLKGDWEVTVGPYETYRNPFQLKAMFQMYIGRENKDITEALDSFKENLQEMENALSTLVGPEIYKSRKLNKKIAIRAIDVWLAAGDGRKDKGATVAYHLPNRGGAVDDGLYKKVMLVNHARAFEPVTSARAKLVMDPSQIGYINSDASMKNTTFHEFAHGFGAYHEMRIKDKKGKSVTVKEALKEHDSLMEELKANAFGIWLLSFQKKNKWIDLKEEKERYTTSVMHLLGLLSYPLSGTYRRLATIQLGYYMSHGALSYDSKKGLFSIDYDKMPQVIESLAACVATIQLTGDYKGACSLIGEYIRETDKETFEIKGVLGEARESMVQKFQKAGIKSPSLRYVIAGL